MYGNDLIVDWRALPQLPECLRTFWEGYLHRTESAVPADEGDEGELQALLITINPDCDYDTWLKCGMALHHATGGSDAGLQLWDEWSSEGTKYKGHADLANRWKGFRTDIETYTWKAYRLMAGSE